MIRALVLLALLGAAVALPKQISRIVGGEETTIEEYPYMSNMQYGWFGIWWFQACGGSVINERNILSAAHCYEGDSHLDWLVLLGSTNVNQGVEHRVSHLRLHPGYSSVTLNNDVAIVTLATPITYSHNIQPARIAGPGYNMQDQTVVAAIGWGTLTQGGSSPTMLNHVHLTTINQDVCAERYAQLKTLPGFQNWPDITPGMLCAGILDVGGKDACQGDSGGPLAHDRNVVVGVTSWGYGCAHPTYPGVNARVSYYSHWIIENSH